jgi:ketosteroid isomerase-like protein
MAMRSSRRRIRNSALIALAVVSTSCVTIYAENRGSSAGIREVRAARKRFNDAIKARDTIAITGLLLPSYHLITGRSVQEHGAAAATARWAAMFADSTLGYVRKTREVRANGRWGIAEENGSWVGHFTAADGPVKASGRYTSKWQRDEFGVWRLQSEVFTTMSCTGGPLGCPPPDPVKF